MIPKGYRKLKVGEEALCYWDNGGLNVLIPKRRGGGFLAVPFWHHSVPALSDIECDERIDLCGLDGCLVLDYGYTERPKRDVIVARVMPELAKHFRFKTWREVGSKEFFSHLLKPERTE